MLNWNLNEGNTSSGGGNKINFTKFPEGVTKIRVLLADGEAPFMRWAHWMPQFSRKVTCPGNCPIDELIKVAKANGQTPPYGNSRNFSVNIWNYDTGRAEVLEEGITMIEALKDGIEEAISEYLEDNPGTKLQICDLVLKVRKKMGSTGKNTWRVTLDSVATMEENVWEAHNNRVDFAEYYKPPTHQQIRELLMVQASTKDEYLEQYNRIMGYGTKQEQEDEGLGVETE